MAGMRVGCTDRRRVRDEGCAGALGIRVGIYFGPNTRADALSRNGFFDITVLLEIEDEDRNLVFAALRNGGAVHDTEVLVNDGVVIQFAVEDCVRIFFWVIAIDTVDAGRFQYDIRAQLQRPLGRGRIGRDERAAGPGGADDHPPLFHVAYGPAADKRFANTVHADGGHHPARAPHALETFLQGQGVDDGRQHTHVMGGGLFDFGTTVRLELSAAEDITPPPQPDRFGNRGLRLVLPARRSGRPPPC